ncbi:hypothetical protein OG384_37070 (plasmid) [Streptomyces sp. NBC_01324]|uniref:hypothetical protein n=1 Tax=Streptomyces sp. NBC_01324 TaxID=2903826 RepID=UPI002E0DDB77|nr:hypothetical protein OG384_37070 [Streptomyces sp. NBC_01324]
MLGDKEVLDAVQGYIEERGESLAEPLSGASAITWHSLLKGQIVRSIESRSEEKHLHPGPLDLSDHPVYDTIDDYQIPRPRDPAEQRTQKMVRRGSIDERSCACGNGEIRCPRCEGEGRIRCEQHQPCGSCRDSTCCLLCDGAGRSALKPAEKQAVAVSMQKAGGDRGDRTRCYECGERDVACVTCRGRGRVQCSTCQGGGSRPCPDCAGDGKVTHEHCAGTGRTVEWTEGTITRAPRTDEVRLPEPGVLYWARRLAEQHATWTPTTLTDNDPLRACVQKDFGSALKPLLRPHHQEVARRTKLEYVRFAKVAVDEHPHRIYYVFPTLKGTTVVRCPSPRRTWQIAGIVASVLLLLVLINRFIA